MSKKKVFLFVFWFGLLSVGIKSQTFIVPSQYTYFNSSNEPFGRGLARYQQAYSAQDIKVGACTLRSIAFKPHKYANCKSHIVDMEINFGYSAKAPVFLESTFSRNILGSLLTIWKRRKTNLPKIPGAGGFIVKFPFDKPFQYDGRTDILLEIRVFGNDIGNKQFFYDLTFASSYYVSYVSNYLSPNAISGTVSKYWGLLTQFEYGKSVFVTYGKGCKGEGGYIPVLTNNGLPRIGHPFYVNVQKIKGNRSVWLAMGRNDKKWGNLTLPFDLSPLGAPGCKILAEMLFLYPTISQGGPAGSGYAWIRFDIPAVNLFIGAKLYFQWVIFAPGANTLNLAFSNGGKAIIDI